MVVPQTSQGAQITARKLTLSTSAGNTAATWTFQFTTAATTALNGIDFQVCTVGAGTCTTPTGWTNAGATLGSATGIGSGFAIDLTTAGSLRIINNANVTTVTNPVTIVFNTVTNPNTTNEAFYVRITTFSGDNYTSAVDTGAVAASTAQQISLTGTMPESLTFCVGTSITGTNCGTISGNTVDFGIFSPSTPSSGTSVMAASSNATSGYSITVGGNTLQSGANSITALAAQTASSPGTSQFGLNLVDNATPNVGANRTGDANANPSGNYDDADLFRYVSGDSVASSAQPTDPTAFTVAYLVNVAFKQPAGVYTTTLTYICTATY
jgi:hypothetical protein